MECNKDEALRAKEIAEKKMQSNEFEGARKIALKAQNLFPELENINQLLMVCNVHCAAESRILGSEKDLYGILQLEKFADEATIKKQYRKLALVLHPDKNKLPGAEAAFKLIGEANMVLLDPAKRAVYDSKCRVSVRTVPKPPPHLNRNPPPRNQFPAQSNIQNGGLNSQFNSVNLNQTTTSNSSVNLEAFWTCCPFCNTKYQYQKKFVNSPLRCQRCSKPFIAYDLGAQGVPSGFNSGQGAQGVPSGFNSGQGAQGVPSGFNSGQGAQGVPSGFNSGQGAQGVPARSNGNQPQQKDMPQSGSSRTGATNTAAYQASRMGSQGKANSRRGKSESGTTTGSTTDVGGKVKTNEKDDKGGTKEGEQRNKGKKRGRKQVVESSESCDSSSSDDTAEVVFDENGGVNGFHSTRRSSRNRQNISYKENKSDDDDFESPPPKKSCPSNASGDGDVIKNEAIGKDELETSKTCFPTSSANMKHEGSDYPEGIPPMGKNQGTAGVMGTGPDKIEIDDDSESDVALDDEPEPVVYECPEPEFNDFDKDKEESCFAVDQIWACYDDVDGMPRFYAQIKKVFKPGFKLRITWLEADPEDQAGVDWVSNELPFGCGRFRRGNNDDVSDRLTFSHQMQCGKGKSRASIVIHPRKGEVWALFNDWDIKWSSNTEESKKFKYEIVEIVSDFVEDVGIRVAYLYKVEGFVSLFQRSKSSEMDLLLIPADELLRFSHRIPSFTMSGTEKKGNKSVPKGSFELDAASLPINPGDICYPQREESQRTE